MAGPVDKTWAKGDPITYAESIAEGATAFTRTRAIIVSAGTYTFQFANAKYTVSVTLLAGLYPFSIKKMTASPGSINIVGLW